MPGRPTRSAVGCRQCASLITRPAISRSCPNLLAVAAPEQYAVLYSIVAASCPPATIEDLAKIATAPPSVKELGSVERIAYGKRRAGAAVTLLRLGEREKVLPVLKVKDDPEALTQFIFRCRGHVESPWMRLLDCLQRVSRRFKKDRVSKNTRYALLLSVGEFSTRGDSRIASVAYSLKQLADWYRHDPSSGIHGATGWLLRQWGQAEVDRLGWITPWCRICLTVMWFTLAHYGNANSTESRKTEPAKENARIEIRATRNRPSPGSRNLTTTAKSGRIEQVSSADREGQTRTHPPTAADQDVLLHVHRISGGRVYDIGSVNDEADRSKNPKSGCRIHADTSNGSWIVRSPLRS